MHKIQVIKTLRNRLKEMISIFLINDGKGYPIWSLDVRLTFFPSGRRRTHIGRHITRLLLLRLLGLWLGL